MKKATNIKNGNVNVKCEYCHKVGFHKMSCPTQKVTVFISESGMSEFPTHHADEKSDNELARQIGKLSDEEFENNCVRLSKMFKQK